MTPDLAITHCIALVGTDGDAVAFIGDATIEITGQRITRIASGASTSAREVIDAHGMVAMPGLINTHTHAAMTLFRGAAEDVLVGEWFNDYIWPMEVNLSAHAVAVGAEVAVAEMLRNGVTTFADNYFFMDDVAHVVERTGVRANLCWAHFSSQGDEGLRTSVDFAERWHGKADGRIHTSIAPHAPYTVSDEHLRAGADEARRLGVKVHVHAAEDIVQTNVSLRDRGQTPIEVLDATGVLDAGAIIAHGNGIIDRDIPLLAAHRDRVGVTHGPKGYLKFALGPITPIKALTEAGVPVGYCTDGAASNNSLDILESMRIGAIYQKQVNDDATFFRSVDALRLAGPASAAVLGQAGDIGELREGALADVVLVDVSGLHCQPLHDLAAALVYSVQPGDVQTVVVDGRVLMRDRELLTIDEAALRAEFRAVAQHITDRTHGRTIQDYPRN